MKKELKLVISNNLEIEEFELEFSNLTYDIYYETFNQDLHIALLRNISVNGGLTRSFAHRLIYAMLKTKRAENIVSFANFLNGLTDDFNEFTQSWGLEFSRFVLDIFGDQGIISIKKEDENEMKNAQKVE